ncbi:hypothetical protein [Clostridium sp. DL1XJH146]
MYKETIMKKKLIALGTMLFLSVLAILLSDFMGTLEIRGQSIDTYSSSIIFVLIIMLNYKQLKKCSIKYKYSIIADQFIIYEVFRDNHQNVKENFRLSEIISIKKIKSNICSKDILCRRYICFSKNRDIYKCNYLKNGQEVTFLFEPSNSLVNKLDKLMEENM